MGQNPQKQRLQEDQKGHSHSPAAQPEEKKSSIMPCSHYEILRMIPILDMTRKKSIRDILMRVVSQSTVPVVSSTGSGSRHSKGHHGVFALPFEAFFPP